MNRRGFLRGTLAAGALAALPVPLVLAAKPATRQIGALVCRMTLDTSAFIKQLARLTGTMNAVAVQGHAPNTLLCVGASGTVTPEGTYECEVEFRKGEMTYWEGRPLYDSKVFDVPLGKLEPKVPA